MVDGPKRHQAGERKARRATRSASSSLRGANVHASSKAERLDGTARQRNRHFNPLGTQHPRL
jgi:hypothetical protein